MIIVAVIGEIKNYIKSVNEREEQKGKRFRLMRSKWIFRRKRIYRHGRIGENEQYCKSGRRIWILMYKDGYLIDGYCALLIAKR